ncbi:MAG: prolipoprotein diacylglyceryl transferase family protein [Gemmatimonadaceae bacterium]
MRRLLFEWGGIKVWSYPAMLYVGLVAGVVAGNIAAHAAGLDAFRVFVATLLLIPPSLAGARLLHVVMQWDIYRNNRGKIWDRNEGGQAQYGGLLVMVPLSLPLLAALDLRLGAFWDVASFTILTGMIFTRVGCLLNGCCAGRPTHSWGMWLPNVDGVWKKRIPTQLLEAAWATALLVSMTRIWHFLPFQGALFLYVVAGYAIGRLALESARELAPGARGFTIHHAISLGMIAVSLGVFTANWP